jgi:hypothetical protein
MIQVQPSVLDGASLQLEDDEVGGEIAGIREHEHSHSAPCLFFALDRLSFSKYRRVRAFDRRTHITVRVCDDVYPESRIVSVRYWQRD